MGLVATNGVTEGWWLGPVMLAEKLKEKSTRKERETEGGRGGEEKRETALLRGCC